MSTKDSKTEQPCTIHSVNGWLQFSGADNIGEFNRRIQGDGDCLVKFDDGTIIRYSEEHPMAVLTHFK